MPGPKQALPPDHPVYQKIRNICRGLGSTLDELHFDPLYGRHTKVLSVEAVIPRPWSGPSLWLTAWYGHRDGRGKDGSTPGYWIRLDEHLPGTGAEGVVPLDPDRPGAGLTYPADLKGKIRKAVRKMHELLVLAGDSHRGLVGFARDRSFAQLNDAAYEGISDALHADFNEDPVNALQTLCEESALESIEFAPYVADAIPDRFSSKTSITLNGKPRQMAVWFESAADGGKDVPWMLVGGWVQRMPREGTDDPEVVWPEKNGGLISEAYNRLLEIHEAAVAIYKDVTTGGPDGAFSLLSAAAEAATKDIPENRPHEGRTWHAGVDEFIRLCRLGIFAGVVVEESLHGGVHIRADTFDPITDHAIRLQVYWVQPGGNEEPVHWIAVGHASEPAHGGDPMRRSLLSGFPQDSRYHLRHAIDHLHDMAHVAVDVVNARTAELLAMIQEMGRTGDIAEAVAGKMKADSIDDSLAGLNGIARLYTGSLERDVRDS